MKINRIGMSIRMETKPLATEIVIQMIMNIRGIILAVSRTAVRLKKLSFFSASNPINKLKVVPSSRLCALLIQYRKIEADLDEVRNQTADTIIPTRDTAVTKVTPGITDDVEVAGGSRREETNPRKASSPELRSIIT